MTVINKLFKRESITSENVKGVEKTLDVVTLKDNTINGTSSSSSSVRHSKAITNNNNRNYNDKAVG